MGRLKGSHNKPKAVPDWLATDTPPPPGPPPRRLAGVTIIIPHRTDPWIGQTCDQVLAHTPDVELIVVQDGWQPAPRVPAGTILLHPWHNPQGVGPSRDAGILAASNAIVISLDAHMRLAPGWAEAMAAPILADPATITCASVWTCNDTGGKWGERTHCNHGARMTYYGSYDGWPMEPGWVHDVGTDRERQCVLGACYALSRQRYMDLGCPWRNCIGWGSSEQILSAVNWFAGGRQWLAACEVDHLYHDRGANASYSTPYHLAVGKYYNRCRLFELLPMPEAEREPLRQAILNAAKSGARDVRDRLAWRDDSAVLAAMATGGRTWDEYKARWWTAADYQEPAILLRVRQLQAAENRRASELFGAAPVARPERGPIECRPADRRFS